MFLFICTSFLLCLLGSLAELTIETLSGTIKGKSVSVGELKVHQFLGIPYAQPPVADLRFKKPLPVNNWTNTLDASKYGPSCVQVLEPMTKLFLGNKNISEDCLHLNIYVPASVSNFSKAVMVWLHGGGYIYGQSTLYDSSLIALTGDVLVVTVNYRLGALGFMSHGQFQGNYGIWDQIEALKWINKNIKFFGGDQERITIFGESAGGCSVGILATNVEHSNGLFQRAIMQSGGYNNPFTIQSSRNNKWIEFLKILGCNDRSLEELTSCLQSKTTQEIFNAQNEYLKYFQFTNINAVEDLTNELPLGPVVDGDLLKESPQESLKSNTSRSYTYYRSLDIMAGVTSSEGFFVLEQVPSYEAILQTKIDTMKGFPRSVLEQIIIPNAMAKLGTNNTIIYKAINDQYGSDNLNEQGRRLVEFSSDLDFNLPLKSAVELHAKDNAQTKTFQYLFDEISPLSLLQDRPSWFVGAAHADELAYLFGAVQTIELLQSSQSQKSFSDAMIKYWTNFAKTGDPNNGSLVKVLWPAYTTNRRQFLHLQAENIQAAEYMFQERMHFWTKTVPDILQGLYISAASTISNAINVSFLCYICVFLVIFMYRYV